MGLGSVLTSAARAQESATAKGLTVHASSPDAVRHFWMGWDDAANVHPAAAARHIQQAMSMDPSFGLAQVQYGFFAPGLSADQREQEIERGMTMLSDASAAEVLLALSWKEWNAGRTVNAAAITRAAAELVPADPYIAGQLVQLGTPGGSPERLAALKKLVAEHPDYAPAYNTLAYAAWAADDHEGGLKAVRRYVELRPDHANPHDSYAELLQWNGQYEEAAAEYRKAIEADGSYAEAHMGLAELSWLAGKHDQARGHIRDAIAKAPAGVPKFQVQRAMAHTYVIEGKGKEAMAGLAAIGRDAEAAGNKGYAQTIYREMAAVDAMLGKGKDIDAHLAAAAALGGGDAPGQRVWAAVAYAGGNRSEAGAALDALERADGKDAGIMNVVRTGRAMVLCAGGKQDQALAALGQPADDMGRVVNAECLKKLKRGAEAKQMTSSVLGNPSFALEDPVRSLAIYRIHGCDGWPGVENGAGHRYDLHNQESIHAQVLESRRSRPRGGRQPGRRPDVDAGRAGGLEARGAAVADGCGEGRQLDRDDGPPQHQLLERRSAGAAEQGLSDPLGEVQLRE